MGGREDPLRSTAAALLPSSPARCAAHLRDAERPVHRVDGVEERLLVLLPPASRPESYVALAAVPPPPARLPTCRSLLYVLGRPLVVTSSETRLPTTRPVLPRSSSSASAAEEEGKRRVGGWGSNATRAARAPSYLGSSSAA